MRCLDLRDDKVYEIFNVTYDSSGFPLFLVYKNNQWTRQNAKNFTPNFNIKYKINTTDRAIEIYD